MGGSGVSVEDGGEVTGAGGKETSEVETARCQPLGRVEMTGVAVARTLYWAATTDLRSASESFAASPVVATGS